MAKPKSKSIAWKALKHAQGPATRVPAQVTQLASETPLERNDAYSLLRGALVGKEQWFDASGPAAGLLLDSFQQAKEPHRTLILVADIVGADHARAWAAGTVSMDGAAVRAEVINRKAVVVAALQHESPAVRGAAAVLLALLPEIRDEVVHLLEPIARHDLAPVVRAATLVSLAACGHGGVLEEGRKSEDQVVRGAAAVAALRLDATRAFGAEREGLEQWLAWQPASPDVDHQLAWFATYQVSPWYRDLPRPDAPARGLAALARARGDASVRGVLDLSFALAESSKLEGVAVQATKIALDLGGFANVGNAGDDRVILPEELSEPQRFVAAGLAKTLLLPRGGFGLPAAGGCRRRWLGLEPPGPLEQGVDVKLPRGSVRMPVWRAVDELHKQPRDPLPEQVDHVLTGLDRWEALILLHACSYGVRLMSGDGLDEEIGRLPAAREEVRARAAKVADDLADRYSAGERMGTPVFRYPLATALLFLPLVRRGDPIDPRWDVLVSVVAQPSVIEVLKALPRERCEAILLSFISNSPPAQLQQNVGNVLQLLPVCPTRRLGELVVQKAMAFEKTLPDWNKYVLDNMRKLAETHPDLRPA